MFAGNAENKFTTINKKKPMAWVMLFPGILPDNNGILLSKGTAHI